MGDNMARGSIRQRQGAKGVSYEVHVAIGVDPVTGKRKQETATFKTKREAEKALALMLVEIDRGGVPDASKTTIGKYFTDWLASYAKPNTRPTTYKSYEIYTNTHLIPALGSILLTKLQPTHLSALYTRKLNGERKDGKEGGLSPRTVRYLHSIVREALQHAFRLGMVLRNVADMVQPPRAVRPPVKVWNAEEASRFLNVAEGAAYSPLWRVLIATGMRRGEALGLRWSDLDWQRSVLQVRQTLIDVQGQLSFGEPKTKSGRRTIALDPITLAVLKEHRLRQVERRLQLGDLWHNLDLVFTAENGNWLHPRNVARTYAALVAKVDVPYIPLHGLRHTSATLLLQKNIHPKIVSERLGHASIGITLDTYSHVLPTMQQEAADAIAAALTGT